MEKYGFKMEHIRERRRKLVDLVLSGKLSSEDVPEIEKSIDTCDCILSLEDKDDKVEQLSKEKLLEDLKEFVTEDYFDEEGIYVRNTLCSLISKLVSKKFSPLSFTEMNLSDDDAVLLVGDMIKAKLGMNHYNIYKSLFVNQKDHVEFSNEFSSLLASFPDTKESFAIIHNHPDIAKASDLAHEAGHYFSSSLSNAFFLGDSVLSEVESMFYELLFMDYLIDENINKADAYSLFSEYISGIIQRAYILNIEFSYPMYKLNSIRDFKVMANKYNLYDITGIFNSKDLLNWINIYNDENPFMYVYSSLIALELFEQYKISRNKKGVVSRYEKFISKVGEIPDYKLASYIERDYIGFDKFKTLRKYKSKYLK